MTPPLIETRGLQHRYGRGGVSALRGVDLTIDQGEFVAIVGANGSGKTTLTKHFNGLLRPTSGDVLIRGQSTRRTTVAVLAATVGYVFQNPDAQIFAYSVQEEVAYALRLRKLPGDAVATRVGAALETMGLEDLRDRHPRSLSGGQRQRLALATVLAMDTEALVLDEPTTGQDSLARRRILALMADLHRAGRTIVLVTHDMSLVAEYASRVVVLHDGAVLADTSPGDLFSRADLLAAASLRLPPAVALARGLGLDGVVTVPEVCDAVLAQLAGR